MTVVATASNPRFTVSRVDIDRRGHAFTIDTLRDLHASAPTPSCSSSPAPTPWPRSCRRRTPTSCSASPTSSASPARATSCPSRACRRTGSTSWRSLPWRSAPPTAATGAGRRARLVPRARRRRPVHLQAPPVCRARTERGRRTPPRSIVTATDHALELARAAAAASAAKLAVPPSRASTSRSSSPSTDVFVIVSAESERQVGSIVDEVEDVLRDMGSKPVRREGQREGRWVLIDFSDIVVHVPARRGAGVLRARAALEGLPHHRPRRRGDRAGRSVSPAREATHGAGSSSCDTGRRRTTRPASGRASSTRRCPTSATQADAVGAAVAALAPDRIVTSDLTRARVTAESVGRATGIPVELDPRFREIHAGAWQGLTSAEVAQRWPPGACGGAAWRGRAPRGDGESMNDVLVRVGEALEDVLAALPAGGCAVVSTHGAAARAVAAWLLDLELRWPGACSARWATATGVSCTRGGPDGACRRGTPRRGWSPEWGRPRPEADLVGLRGVIGKLADAPLGAPPLGAVAQLVAHLHGMEGCRGSIPWLHPTHEGPALAGLASSPPLVHGRWFRMPPARESRGIPHQVLVTGPGVPCRHVLGQVPRDRLGVRRLRHVLPGPPRPTCARRSSYLDLVREKSKGAPASPSARCRCGCRTTGTRPRGPQARPSPPDSPRHRRLTAWLPLSRATRRSCRAGASQQVGVDDPPPP